MSGTTPEGKVKKQVRKLLEHYEGVYRFMPVQNGMGETTLDFLCCFNGKFFSIETKAPGKTVTLRQQGTIDKMKAAGAEVFVIDGPFSLAMLKDWLDAAH